MTTIEGSQFEGEWTNKMMGGGMGGRIERKMFCCDGEEEEGGGGRELYCMFSEIGLVIGKVNENSFQGKMYIAGGQFITPCSSADVFWSLPPSLPPSPSYYYNNNTNNNTNDNNNNNNNNNKERGNVYPVYGGDNNNNNDNNNDNNNNDYNNEEEGLSFTGFLICDPLYSFYRLFFLFIFIV